MGNVRSGEGRSRALFYNYHVDNHGRVLVCADFIRWLYRWGRLTGRFSGQSGLACVMGGVWPLAERGPVVERIEDDPRDHL